MILCVTPNPAVDRTLVVNDFAAGIVSRAQSTLAAAGGKGLNVARACRILGHQPLCMGFLGGSMGHYVAELAEREGISGSWTWISGETRTCTIILNPEKHEATVINEQGPNVDADDWTQLYDDVLKQMADASVVCFSGSLPPGSPMEAYNRLIRAVLQQNKPVWLDTSGEPLRLARSIPHISIKVNGDEVGTVLGRLVDNPESAVNAAQELRDAGLETVVVTLGAMGAVMADSGGHWWAKPPSVQVVDPIGSGDSFLAGLVTSFEAGCAVGECLRRAVAAGAANALSVGGGQFSMSEYHHILSETVLQSI